MFGGLRALLRLSAPASFTSLLIFPRSGSFSGFVLVFMDFPLIWAADSGFRVFSASVICVVPLWVMNTTLFFTVPLFPRCGTVTPSCLLVPLGHFGSSFGKPICVRLYPSSGMHSRLVQTSAGCGDLAAAPSVAAPPSFSPSPFSYVPLGVTPSFGSLGWPGFLYFG